MTTALISINYDGEQPTVSARELHNGLEIKSKYADWFKNMSAYGFTENIDYVTISKKLETGFQQSSVWRDPNSYHRR